MTPELSVIIPAYNVEKYVEDCIDSIMGNTFRNFEVILVDDGSTDNTGNLCDQLSEKYPKLRAFHTENHGIAECRNFGLDHAEGKYISFVDSDDVVASTMFQKLMDGMSTGEVQLVACRALRCKEGEVLPFDVENEKKKHFLNVADAARQIILEGYGPYVCNKLFRKDIIQKYHIYFPQNCRANEDTFYTWHYMKYCRKCLFLEEQLYGYIKHDGSITNTFRKNRIVNDAYMNLPRGWRYCAEVVGEIAPELLPEAESRTAMFYQTVLRKLRDPDQTYIKEARTYAWEHRKSLRHYPWGKKYYLSAILLHFSYPLWSRLSRRMNK